MDEYECQCGLPLSLPKIYPSGPLTLKCKGKWCLKLYTLDEGKLTFLRDMARDDKILNNQLDGTTRRDKKRKK